MKFVLKLAVIVNESLDFNDEKARLNSAQRLVLTDKARINSFQSMNPSQRRHILIQEMEELELQGKSCRGCEGTCCTYEANSMMVTPLEALDLYHYLKSHSLFTAELRQKLESTISQYRLDHVVSTGKRTLLRRTYTCPFFNHQELGCPLPREVKPYGCLGFNSRHTEMKKGEHCYSNKELLEKREAHFEEDSENKKIRREWNLSWDKTPLPIALLDLLQADTK